MTDPVWLNMFRNYQFANGTRETRGSNNYLPPYRHTLIAEINNEFKRIADCHGLKNDYGFITPLDNGKRCVFEYDYLP